MYWALLYHTSWAYGISMFSIVYFAVNLIGHLIGFGIGFVGLCCAGTLATITCSLGTGSCIGNIIFLLTILLVAFVLVLQFGVSIWGLILSIDLLNSGGDKCPIGTVDCKILVILFFLSLFFAGLRSRSNKSQSTPKNFTRINETTENGVVVRTTEVAQRGFITTTVERTENGITATTTNTQPMEDQPMFSRPKAIVSTLLMDPKVSLQFQSRGGPTADTIELNSMSV